MGQMHRHDTDSLYIYFKIHRWDLQKCEKDKRINRFPQWLLLGNHRIPGLALSLPDSLNVGRELPKSFWGARSAIT